jgi:Ca2+-binding EF-hand superfamily protein
LTEEEIEAFIRRVNVTGTGRITYSEFSDALLAPKTFPVYERAGSIRVSPTRRLPSPSRRLPSPTRTVTVISSPTRRTIVREEVPLTTLSPSRRVYSPLRIGDEEELAISLKEQIELDKQIEAAKIDLAIRVDFNLMDAFRIFDVAGKGTVTKLEVEDALARLKVYPSRDELDLFFKRYDRSGAGVLR